MEQVPKAKHPKQLKQHTPTAASTRPLLMKPKGLLQTVSDHCLHAWQPANGPLVPILCVSYFGPMSGEPDDARGKAVSPVNLVCIIRAALIFLQAPIQCSHICTVEGRHPGLQAGQVSGSAQPVL